MNANYICAALSVQLTCGVIDVTPYTSYIFESRCFGEHRLFILFYEHIITPHNNFVNTIYNNYYANSFDNYYIDFYYFLC